MIVAGAYSGYVVAAYGLSGLAFVGVGLWVFLDARRQRRALRALEEGGTRRRSATARPG